MSGDNKQTASVSPANCPTSSSLRAIMRGADAWNRDGDLKRGESNKVRSTTKVLHMLLHC
jgi:hypothetical protein